MSNALLAVVLSPRELRLAAAVDDDGKAVRDSVLDGGRGLSVDETAAVLAISAQSLMRDWKLDRAWLMRELREL